MDDFFTAMPSLLSEGFGSNSFKQYPAVNVTETEAGYEMEVVAPGFEKEHFTVNVEDKMLVISAEQKKENNEQNTKSILKEFELKSFKRSFSIDETIDTEGICAKYVNGVLTLNLPRKNNVKESKKQITIE
jgi:HSP20 family protein